MTIRRTICASLLGLLTGFAQAQGADGADFPARPIRMLVPLSAGTTTDLVARKFADRMAQRLNQPVLVENRQGAGGTIAAQALAKSAPDGYTILLVNSQHAINPAAYATLPYDTVRDFAGIAMVGEAVAVVAVSKGLGVHNIGEFVAFAKRKPGEINYGSSGIGSQTHLAGAYFASQAGISLTHVPYRSSPDVISDLLTNRIQAVFAPAAFLQAQIKDGKVQALAVTGRERVGLLSDVPTVGESALRGFEFSTWFGFLAPAKTPPHILALLAKTLQGIAEEPAVRQTFADQGISIRVSTLRDFDALIKSEIDRLSPIVLASGVREK